MPGRENAHAAAGARSTLVSRTLLAMARQRPGFEEPRCQLALDCLATGEAMREALRLALHSERLSELRFSVLVVLFALEPDPSTAADLACHAGVTRSSVTEALDGLQAAGLISRERDRADRRAIYVRLTPAGREKAEAALVAYLQAATHLTRFVGPDEFTAAIRIGARLRDGAVLPLD